MYSSDKKKSRTLQWVIIAIVHIGLVVWHAFNLNKSVDAPNIYQLTASNISDSFTFYAGQLGSDIDKFNYIKVSPLYPLILSMVSFFGKGLLPLIIVQHLFSLVFINLLFRFFTQLDFGFSVRKIIFVLLILNPFYWYMLAQPEPFIFIAIFVLLALISGLGYHRTKSTYLLLFLVISSTILGLLHGVFYYFFVVAFILSIPTIISGGKLKQAVLFVIPLITFLLIAYNNSSKTGVFTYSGQALNQNIEINAPQYYGSDKDKLENFNSKILAARSAHARFSDSYKDMKNVVSNNLGSSYFSYKTYNLSYLPYCICTSSIDPLLSISKTQIPKKNSVGLIKELKNQKVVWLVIGIVLLVIHSLQTVFVIFFAVLKTNIKGKIWILFPAIFALLYLNYANLNVIAAMLFPIVLIGSAWFFDGFTTRRRKKYLDLL